MGEWKLLDDEQEIATLVLAGDVFNAGWLWDGGSRVFQVFGMDPKGWPEGLTVRTISNRYWRWTTK